MYSRCIAMICKLINFKRFQVDVTASKICF